jgi:hypothetical protein
MALPDTVSPAVMLPVTFMLPPPSEIAESPMTLVPVNLATTFTFPPGVCKIVFAGLERGPRHCRTGMLKKLRLRVSVS